MRDWFVGILWAIDASGAANTQAARGRQDPCVLPRAVLAGVALVFADYLLRQQGHCRL